MTLMLLISLLSTGFMLGIFHALDADHLATLSALAHSPGMGGRTLVYAMSWATGHGALLIGVSATLILAGWQMPAVLPARAEWLVGFILLTTGATAIWLARSRVTHARRSVSRPLRAHIPFCIGLVHGMAGSAALLGLIPVALYRPALGLLYAVLFSAGVLVGMVIFAFMFERFQRFVADRVPDLHRVLRMATGALAMGMGFHWLGFL